MGQQASGSFQSHVMPDAGEDVRNFSTRRYRMTHTVGGEQWQTIAPGNLDR